MTSYGNSFSNGNLSNKTLTGRYEKPDVTKSLKSVKIKPETKILPPEKQEIFWKMCGARPLPK